MTYREVVSIEVVEFLVHDIFKMIPRSDLIMEAIRRQEPEPFRLDCTGTSYTVTKWGAWSIKYTSQEIQAGQWIIFHRPWHR